MLRSQALNLDAAPIIRTSRGASVLEERGALQSSAAGNLSASSLHLPLGDVAMHGDEGEVGETQEEISEPGTPR